MDRDVQARSVEQFRTLLCQLARRKFPAGLRGKLDPSDIVQQTLLEAHARRAQFRGTTEGERAAWLQLMLLHNLADARRAFGQARRDLARECPLREGPSSSAGTADWLAADQSSPSQQAARAEQAARLAEALIGLPEGQRQAVLLYYWHEASVADMAREMGRSPAAVAGLLKRGLKQLRKVLHERE
jgi:RNA polymerase sigma-70 factor (ECF subfamily)